MGKYQTIYGLHSVRAALLNKKRINDELIVTENHKILGKKYQYKIKKIKILKPQDFKKKLRRGEYDSRNSFKNTRTRKTKHS